MNISGDGVSEEKLRIVQTEAEKMVDEHLQAVPSSVKKSIFWEIANKQLSTTMSILQQHHKRENQLLASNRREKLAQVQIEKSCVRYNPNDIKIDVTQDGFLGSGGFGTVRVGYITHYGAVAVKVQQLRGLNIDQTTKIYFDSWAAHRGSLWR